MICKECQNEQDEGKFCGQCGGVLVAKQEEVVVEEKQVEQSKPVELEEGITYSASTEETTEKVSNQLGSNEQINENIEVAKEKLSTFMDFFNAYIKKPSNILGNVQNEFFNGLTSIVLNLFLVSLTISLIGKNFVGSYITYSVIGNLFKIFIMLAISIVAMGGLSFILNKLFGIKMDYREFTAIYGAYTLPVVIFSALGLLLGIINSNGVAITLVAIAISLSIFAIPSYLVILLLSRSESSIDPFYGYLIYMVGAVIVYLILMTIIVDSALGDIINDMSYYF